LLGTVLILGTGGLFLIINAVNQINNPVSVTNQTSVTDTNTLQNTNTTSPTDITNNPTNTLSVTLENTSTPELTVEPKATMTPLSDSVASDTKTLEFTDSVFLRSGPGTNYTKLGSEPAGYVAPVTGKSEDGQWYQIAYGARNRVWVSALWASVTGGAADLPIIQAPATPTLLPSSTPTISATATSSSEGLSLQSSESISGKTFKIDAMFVPGITTPRFLIGESFDVDMRIVNSSSSYVSFGAWGVHSNLFPNFIYIFNGDRPADQIGANTEYSWDNTPISITNPGLHYLQMGICLDNAANCLATKAPGDKWYILSDSIPVTISATRLSPVSSDGSPIIGTYFSAEKTCSAGSACSTNYAINEQIFLNLRIQNTSPDDKAFGAWGVFANPTIKRFFNGDGDADKVGGGTEYSWRDWISFDAAGTYDLQMVVCLDNASTCSNSSPPENNWHVLSGAIPVTIK
tara:strand:- start:2154 stop:3536 length:1383 start_codon:yes stop_codon:yes gene_type:complete